LRRLLLNCRRSSLYRRLLRRSPTAAANKQTPTAILCGFSVYRGGRMDMKISFSLSYSLSRDHHRITSQLLKNTYNTIHRHSQAPKATAPQSRTKELTESRTKLLQFPPLATLSRISQTF
jgi:hypothetical protein